MNELILLLGYYKQCIYLLLYKFYYKTCTTDCLLIIKVHILSNKLEVRTKKIDGSVETLFLGIKNTLTYSHEALEYLRHNDKGDIETLPVFFCLMSVYFSSCAM